MFDGLLDLLLSPRSAVLDSRSGCSFVYVSVCCGLFGFLGFTSSEFKPSVRWRSALAPTNQESRTTQGLQSPSRFRSAATSA